jgi:hypothetical protein
MKPSSKLLLILSVALCPSPSVADICGDIEKVYDQAFESKLSDWAGSKKDDDYISKFRLDGASSCYLKTPYDNYLGEYSCEWDMGTAKQSESAFKSVSQAILKCPFLSGGVLNESPQCLSGEKLNPLNHL